MVTTEHTGANAIDAREFAGHGGGAEGPASVERLVEHAAALKVRAPELSLILGERAAAIAESTGANEHWVRAESIVVHARVRLGHRASTVGRAVTALRAAEDAGQPVNAATVRSALAVCARAVGAPLTGLAALRPVLTIGGLSSVQRAAALCHLVGCLGTFGRKVELDRVLMEGDRLVSADARLADDDRLIARALLRVGVSAHRRRHGDLVGAADAARTGIGFLDDLGDPALDGGLARVRLTLELVCSLLDRGDAELAMEVAEPLLAEPERAGSVAPLGWLRMAIATRVQLLNASAESAARNLREAVRSTSRHGLYALTARLWLELANVEERIGEAGEAIQCLYRARAAEHLHTRVSSQARAVLTGAFGSGEQAPVDLAEMVAAAARAATEHPTSRREDESAKRRPTEEKPGGRRRADRRDASGRPRVVLPMLRRAGTADGDAPSAPSGAAAGTPRTATTAPEPRASVEEVSATEITEVTPIVTDDPPAPLPRRRRRKPEPEEAADRASWDVAKPPFTTASAERSALVPRSRHDSEHGSVAARSVLDRLGVSPGASGGRRRAADRDSAEEEPASAPTGATTVAGTDDPVVGGPVSDNVTTESASSDSTAVVGTTTASADAPVSPPSPGLESAGPRKNTSAAPSGDAAEGYGWLPRLRLPPALAPLGETPEDSAAASEDPPPPNSGHSGAGEVPPATDVPSGAGSPGADPSESRRDEHVERSGAPYAGAPTDDPPPDAGLAELLARALAEHQAGTASAAALVKQLGVDDEQPRVNGRHRGGN